MYLVPAYGVRRPSTQHITATTKTRSASSAKRKGICSVCLQKNKKLVKMVSSNKLRSVKSLSAVRQPRQTIYMEGQNISFEVDTGASDNFISKECWSKIGKPPLQGVDVQYESASKHSLPVLGAFTTKVTAPNTTCLNVTSNLRCQRFHTSIYWDLMLYSN